MIINCPVEKNLLKKLKQISIISDDEICGFLIKEKNMYVDYIPCANLHPDKKNFFLINPSSYVFNEEIGLFHSHPKHCLLNGFSEWDLENQKYFCLDMLLYSVNNDKFYFQKYD